MTNEERIKADAEAATDKEELKLKELNVEYGRMLSRLSGHKTGYIAGATAEHDRAQVLVDALEFVKHCPVTYDKKELLMWIDSAIEKAKLALEQWKSGKGKEVGDGLP